MAYTTIDKPTDYFNTITYTGDDVDGRTITGVGFQSDWTWVKARSSAFSHYIIDSIRYDSGASKYLKLDSSYNGANETPSGAGWISQLNSDGYVCKNGTSNTNNCNENSVTYVAWNWLADNTSGSSNTDGSITSTVSANTTSGFSIVKYTGNATNSTVGHGLGVTPQVVIVKNLDSTGASAEHWRVQHHKVAASKVLYLNRDVAEDTNGDFQSTYPTSSYFSISSADGCNKNGEENIAYCFAEKKGYSKFGSYTGNGNADGTFIYTGFSPSFVMHKRTDTTNNWIIQDNKRVGYNADNRILKANLSDAEQGVHEMDFVSNGFKIRTTGAGSNASGGTYIYMAFAESPFVTSTGIPTTAR